MKRIKISTLLNRADTDGQYRVNFAGNELFERVGNSYHFLTKIIGYNGTYNLIVLSIARKFLKEGEDVPAKHSKISKLSDYGVNKL